MIRFILHILSAITRVLKPGGPKGTDEIKSVPYAPRTHPVIERAIKTTRNDLLDRASP